jgi:hypothetical protein
MAQKEPPRVRQWLKLMIESDKWRAIRKHNGVSLWAQWRNPSLPAYYGKVVKHYEQLHAVVRATPEDNTARLDALFCAYASYKSCLVDGWDKETLPRERECFNGNLREIVNPCVPVQPCHEQE